MDHSVRTYPCKRGHSLCAAVKATYKNGYLPVAIVKHAGIV